MMSDDDSGPTQRARLDMLVGGIAPHSLGKSILLVIDYTEELPSPRGSTFRARLFEKVTKFKQIVDQMELPADVEMMKASYKGTRHS
jgi:hypothetical protein